MLFVKSFPYSMFQSTPGWVSVPVDGVSVNGEFYVACSANAQSPPTYMLELGFDSSVTNEHSEVIGPSWRIADWIDKLNLGIRGSSHPRQLG